MSFERDSRESALPLHCPAFNNEVYLPVASGSQK
jgi:hypothetical protein